MAEAVAGNTKPPTAAGADKGKSTATTSRKSRKMIFLFLGVAAVGAGVAAWLVLRKPALPAGFAGGNGRLEATQIYVSTKYPGRIAEVLVNEGATIEPGQIVARMDTSALQAQLREAEAQIRSSQDARNAALAQVAVKQADFNYANKQDARSRELVPRGAVSQQEAEIDHAASLSAKAQLAGAQAQAVQSVSQIDAARATADRLRAEIADSVLRAPMRARVERRLGEPGEVLGAGGRVFSVNDLSDVYMYVYLPEKVTGKIPLGSEARIVLDAAPEYPIRAVVSYVSPMAQFTPKTVETAEERHNLTFRVKLQIPKERLREFEPLVKTGLPGMGYVRWDTSKDWPERLQPKATVPKNLWQPTGSSTGAN
ncbi:HlyD family efflux transporter periplasmic adaptor subunit [Phenylobacterium sp. LjRoot219]|uniref:HlyD family secretion protein n=1 Tax=Phenylobacterium sp. LjRoot219 TaxID=3342283 RepID=UPI003ECD190E